MAIGLGAITGGLQALGGLAQFAFSGVKKANRRLEKFVNSYKPNASILDYYNKALNNYSANPYTSQSYQNQTNRIGRNLATGISASQDRRGGLANISALVQGSNDAEARAASQAEAAQRQNLGVLGGATRMKAQEDFKPFEMKYNLLAAKAGAAATQKRQGLQNMFGGFSNAAASGLKIGGNGNSNVPYDTYDYTGNTQGADYA